MGEVIRSGVNDFFKFFGKSVKTIPGTRNSEDPPDLEKQERD